MPTVPAKALSNQVRALLLDLIGTRPDGTRAFRATETANALTSGEVGQATTNGLEVAVSLFPEDESGRPMFGSVSGGVLHYAVVVRAPAGKSTWPARERFLEAFPLLSTQVARRPRLSLETDISFETLQLHLPIITD